VELGVLSLGDLQRDQRTGRPHRPVDRIFAQVDWGGLPADLVGESIARYATEIAPALRS
jgi:hypothetical protein